MTESAVRPVPVVVVLAEHGRGEPLVGDQGAVEFAGIVPTKRHRNASSRWRTVAGIACVDPMALSSYSGLRGRLTESSYGVGHRADLEQVLGGVDALGEGVDALLGLLVEAGEAAVVLGEVFVQDATVYCSTKPVGSAPSR